MTKTIEVKWIELVSQAIKEHCNTNGNVFTLKNFLKTEGAPLLESGHHPKCTTRLKQVHLNLQLLRDKGEIEFLDNKGTYMLKGSNTTFINVSKETPSKREYLTETFVRSSVVAGQARAVCGDKCLCDGCTNTFTREDGTNYIEGHHIIPLCEGGIDDQSNIASVCAHHHRMCHSADAATKQKLQTDLLSKVASLSGTAVK